MATYTTQANLELAYKTDDLKRLSNNDGSATTIDATVITALISDMSDMMDNYLRARYTLPLDQTYTSLTLICNRMVWYYLNFRASFMSEFIRKDYEDSIKELDKLTKGITVLEEQSVTESGFRSIGGVPTAQTIDSVTGAM